MPPVEQVEVSSLTLYPDFGRIVNQRRLTTLRQDWYPPTIGVIAISERADGTRLVIEGNHRVTVAQEKGLPAIVPALVYRGLTPQQEAEMARKLNDQLAQTALDHHRTDVYRGDPTANSIKAQVEDAGYRIAQSGGRSSGLRCIQTLNGLAASYGVHHIYPTLTFCRHAFGLNTHLHNFAIQGVASVLWAYKDTLDVKRLEDVTAEIGAKRLKNYTDNEALESLAPKHVCYAKLLVDAYNFGLSKGKNSRRIKEWDTSIYNKVNKNERDVRRAGQRASREAVWNERIAEAAARPS